MAAWPVEEMAAVSEGSPELEDRSPGIGFNGEAAKLLATIPHRRQEEGHNRSAHRSVIAELQLVPDAVARAHDGSPASTG